jgi:hypothetical protein
LVRQAFIAGHEDLIRVHDRIGWFASTISFAVLLAFWAWLTRKEIQPQKTTIPLPGPQTSRFTIPALVAVVVIPLIAMLVTAPYRRTIPETALNAWRCNILNAKHGWSGSRKTLTTEELSQLRPTRYEVWSMQNVRGGRAEVSRFAWDQGESYPLAAYPHVPENCMPPQGWKQAKPPTDMELDAASMKIKGRLYEFTKPGQVQYVFYAARSFRGEQKLPSGSDFIQRKAAWAFSNLHQEQMSEQLSVYLAGPLSPEEIREQCQQILSCFPPFE